MLDIRTDYLFLCLAFILLWEHFSPREVLNNVKKRWSNNFYLYLINISIKWLILLCLSVFFNYVETTPYTDVSVANVIPRDISIFILTILIIDLFSYCQHRVFHHYQILWRTHLVHHSDVNLDVSTNFRHHPFEHLLTYLIYALFIFLLKLPVLTVMIYGAIASVMQLWHHSNTKLPANVDSFLRRLIITPSLHKLHHSAFKEETNSNYGTLFSFWDRFFGTLCEYEQKNKVFNYGLEYFREEKQLDFLLTLKQPLSYKPEK